MKYEFHPIAGIMPMIEGVEFDELVADIKKHGLLVPIVLYEGKILDGRNRQLACDAAGVKPKYVQFKGDDPIAWVLSINAKRRHLKDIQRAEMVIREQEIRNSRKDIVQITNAELFKKHKISERTVKRVKAILKSGNEEVIEAVRKEEIGILAAHNIVKGVSIDTPYEDKTIEIEPKTTKVIKKVESIYGEDFQEAFGITDEKLFEELIIKIRKTMEVKNADPMDCFVEILELGKISNDSIKMAELIKASMFCYDFGSGYMDGNCSSSCNKSMCEIWKGRFVKEDCANLHSPGKLLECKAIDDLVPETSNSDFNGEDFKETMSDFKSGKAGLVADIESSNGILKGVDLKPVVEVERINRDMVVLEQPKIVSKPVKAVGWDKPQPDINDMIEDAAFN